MKMKYVDLIERIVFYISVLLVLTMSNSIEELPMDRLNLWIDRKEIKQFVGEYFVLEIF